MVNRRVNGDRCKREWLDVCAVSNILLCAKCHPLQVCRRCAPRAHGTSDKTRSPVLRRHDRSSVQRALTSHGSGSVSLGILGSTMLPCSDCSKFVFNTMVVVNPPTSRTASLRLTGDSNPLLPDPLDTPNAKKCWKNSTKEDTKRAKKTQQPPRETQERNMISRLPPDRPS